MRVFIYMCIYMCVYAYMYILHIHVIEEYRFFEKFDGPGAVFVTTFDKNG